jgi:hypothetical protein
MRSNQEYGGWMSFIEKFKLRWTKVWGGILQSLSDEEMRIQRGEYDKRSQNP